MAASVGYFIEYIMMHGTTNIKVLVYLFIRFTPISYGQFIAIR